MIALHSQNNRPYSDIGYLGVAIRGTRQRHVGLLLRTNKAHQPKILHLAFHNELTYEEPKDYWWVDCPEFDDEEQLQLATWLEKVWQFNGNRIPYGLAYSAGQNFDPLSGRFVGKGLTCATFICALFEDFGLPIIKKDTWIEREDDVEWQNHITTILRQRKELMPHFCSQEHIDDQIALIGKEKRIRPEEVVGAAGVDNHPVDFERVLPLAGAVLVQMGLT